MVDNLATKMRRIDPAAFADPDRWWPVILGQVAAGLMRRWLTRRSPTVAEAFSPEDPRDAVAAHRGLVPVA